MTNPSSDLDLCVRCGNCKALCPTHIEFAEEGMSARGRIELLRKFFSGELDATDILDDRIYTCLLCGSCDNCCPRGIPVTDAVYEARRRLAFKGKRHKFYRALIKHAFRNRALAFSILPFLERLGLHMPFTKIRPFSTMRELRPDIPETRLREDISVFKVQNPQGRVALFAGCTVEFLYPAMGKAFIQALNALDYEVVLPKAEVCCGAPLLSMGLTQEAKYLARKNLDAFKKLKVDAVISLCPTCTHFIRDVYQNIMGEGLTNATDISKFLCDASHLTSLNPPEKKPGKVVYHAPCHTVNYLGAVEEPGRILGAMGVDFSEPAERGCCGFGGVVRLLHDDVSNAITSNRIGAFEGADMVVTSCPNCVLQLQSMIKDRPVKHIIELIAAGLRRH
jgi:glycolate oxidase iron-sulfur subunit